MSNIPFYFPNRQLVIQKIENKKLDSYKLKLDKIFMNPDNYFTNICEGKLVIVGSKNKGKFSEVPNINKTSKKNYLSKTFKRLSTISKNISTSLRKSNITGHGQSSRSVSGSNKGSPSTNKVLIKEDDLNDLFESYKKDKKENRLPKNKNLIENQMIDEFCGVSKLQIGKLLKTQEKALKKYESESENMKHMSNYISKRIKRPIKDLLMNQNENFRIIREFRDKYSQEIKNREPRTTLDWIIRLRDEHSDHFANIGIRSPQWYLYRFKQNQIETIRNPNSHFNLTDKYFKSSKNYPYLAHKISKKKINEINNEFYKTTDGFNHMSLKGSDLLEFEIEHANLFKGKKKLINIPQNSNVLNLFRNIDDKFKPQLIKKHDNFKELMKSQK